MFEPVFSFSIILHLSLATDALLLKSVCIYFLLPSPVSSFLTAPCRAKGTQSPDTPTELLQGAWMFRSPTHSVPIICHLFVHLHSQCSWVHFAYRNPCHHFVCKTEARTFCLGENKRPWKQKRGANSLLSQTDLLTLCPRKKYSKREHLEIAWEKLKL